MRLDENSLNVSVYLHNTDTTFVSVSPWVLSLVSSEKVDYATVFTKAAQTAVSTERVAHFFIEIRIQLPFPLNEKHLPFQNHITNIFDGADADSYLGFIRLYDYAVFEDCDTTAIIIRKMDDHYHRESHNFDTQL